MQEADEGEPADRFGHQGVSPAAGGFDANGFPDLSDILNEMFGFGDVFNSDDVFPAKPFEYGKCPPKDHP